MKVLIANRGEIAVRAIRACRELGLPCVAVYSEGDRAAPHVRLADEACLLGPSEPARSYLAIDRIVDAARRSGATAVHPGYGFLAENPDFARACGDAGLVFIGPSADVIEQMGSKTAARTAAQAAGVPVVPGSGELADPDDLGAVEATAGLVGYPLFVKAVAGGGGKGMRSVAGPADLVGAVRAARSEASSSFGDSRVYLERRLDGPRHIEVQLLGDVHGTVRAFVERECSIQRRHQKVLEETPSIAVDPGLREALASSAVALARAVGYVNAGTIEFLLDRSGQFYFLEMNTRLQVEHPITELVTGVDLVQWQIRIARGEALDLQAADLLRPNGHAIECRIYAEDPDNGFLPNPGCIRTLRRPSGPGIREDSGVEAGYTVPVHYDSLISKLIAWGGSRSQATARLRRALAEYRIGGIETTIPFFRWLLDTEAFASGQFDTTFLDRELATRMGRPFVEVREEDTDLAATAAALYKYLQGAAATVPAGTAARPAGGGWRQAARTEALRS